MVLWETRGKNNLRNLAPYCVIGLSRNDSLGMQARPHPGSTGVELGVDVGNRQARRAAMFIVPRSNALKLHRSAMLTEHFAPTGLRRGGVAMAINIALLTEFSCVCPTENLLIQRQYIPALSPRVRANVISDFIDTAQQGRSFQPEIRN